MKRLLRTLLAAIGVLGLVMVGAVVYVTTFVDPNDLKPRLVEVVREHSGLELALEGPLAWSFYPRLGVSVEAAEAHLPTQETEAAPFAAFDHAEVSLAFAPLLRGEIAIDGLTLDGVVLNLARNAQGEGNWQVLLERLGERGEQAEAVLAPASAGANPEAPGASGLPVALNIASVEVRNGEVYYRDVPADRELLIEQLAITGSNVNPRRAFPLSTAFRLVMHDTLDGREKGLDPAIASDMTLDARMQLGLVEGRHVLSDLSLKTSTLLENGEEAQEASLVAKELAVDLKAQQLRLDGGTLEASLLHPQLGDKRLPLTLSLLMEADLAEQTAQLRELSLTGPDGLDLSGNLGLEQLGAAPRYSGQVRLAPLSLRPWLVRLRMMPTMAGTTALSQVALTSPVSGDLSAIELDGLTLALDDSTLTGRLAAGFDGRRLAIDLQGDRLNLDAYLPPRDAARDGASARLPGVGRAWAEEDKAPLVPASWLAELDLDAHLALGELRLTGLAFQDVDLSLEGRDGRHRLTAFEAGFHEGRLAATGELDVRQAPLRWQLSPTLSRIRLASLLETLSDEPAPLSGRFSGKGRLEARGNRLGELTRSLNGRLTSRLDEGAIVGTNVSRELCTAVATLEGEATRRDWAPDTRFERAEASFDLRDGVAYNEDLTVILPGIEIGGSGQLDLVSERFELSAAARLVGGVDAACEVNPRLARVPFPVRCEGQLDGDRAEWCRFDRDAFQATLVEQLRAEAGRRAGEEVEKQLDDAVQKLEEKLGDKAGSELRGALEGLFK
ncbi:AsmA family protein [Halomonas cerina]|uniref:AsmA protein n=1 Tax=Halomonas cerina TaxID=447424 RepID=A0A839VDG2_9GAMM|nr:AsmA family protein [Halomonas cerina]MBB3192095.1 AsmA protein [Halomonas cerina]